MTHHIKIPKGWEMPEEELTPESIFMNRREVLQGMGWIGALSASLLYGCAPGSTEVTNAHPQKNLTALEKTLYPATRVTRYKMDRRITEEAVAASYNNYYEFSEVKEDVDHHAQKLKTRPWQVEVTGLVEKPKTYDLDDLLKKFHLEERFYRLRCVEAWAMAVPWTGFPLKALLDEVQPLSKAKYVRLVSFHKPFTAQGQIAFWQPWPYSEALTVKEAMNELTLLVTGIYGHPLPKQHGAPVRLVVPWKYGFKSIKAIQRIELIDYKPQTFWNTLQPHEYGFTANVDPGIPHPRWPQTKEEMLGTKEIRLTQLYNGYSDFVADLYA